MKNKNSPIFGDDGFRSQFGKGLMSKRNLIFFASSLSNYVYKKKLQKYPIIIARDTRESGIYIETLLTNIFTSSGLNVVLAKVLPTPALSKLIELEKYSCGVMITASHNPASDNGIKLFSQSGYKMPLKEEKIIEEGIRKQPKLYKKYFPGKLSIKDDSNFIYHKNLLKNQNIFKIDYSIAIDCSNGATSHIVNKLFGNNNNYKIIHNRPNGKNINYKCGALETKKLLKYIKINKIDFGVAFDGDGDRSVFVSRQYGVIETEKLFYLICSILFKNLKNKSVVVSEVFNFGIIKLLRKKFKKVWITKAGDRNIIEKLRLKKSILGAEPSGHFNFPEDTRSMDGLVTFIQFLKVIKKRGNNINDELKNIKLFTRIIKDLPIKKEVDKQSITKINKLGLKIGDRLLVRKSMWEPVLRVYYDYEYLNNFHLYEKELKSIQDSH